MKFVENTETLAPPARADIPPLHAGESLGRYQLLAPLASGGMADVWVGRQVGALGFSRLVAIKCIRNELCHDLAFRRMFLDEASIASRLRHANVVDVTDLGEATSTVFLVMPLVDGASVARLVKAADGGRIPVPVVLRIAVDACTGLHAAHELVGDDGRSLELVHRDVSPHNLLVGLDGTTRLTDFGIAKSLGRLEETEAGQVKGKFAYMSPEQIERAALDRRSDVFSMGVVLWELFAGRRLFAGDDAIDTLRRVQALDVPPLRAMAPDLPPEIARAVEHALARDPAARTPSAEALCLEISAAGMGAASSAEVASWVKRLVGAEIDQRYRKIRAFVGQEEASHESAPAPRAEGLTVLDEHTPTSIHPVKAPSRRWLWLLLAGLALLVGSAFLFRALGRPSKVVAPASSSLQATQRAPSASSASSAPSPSAGVVIAAPAPDSARAAPTKRPAATRQRAVAPRRVRASKSKHPDRAQLMFDNPYGN